MAGSGLFTTFGYAFESSYGTFQLPATFLWAHKEGGSYTKNTVQSSPLHGGLFDLSSRRAFVSKEAKQSLDLDLEDRNLGGLFLAMFGAAAGTVTNTVDTIYFTPADLQGNSISIQVGRPSTNDSTLVAMSYLGCKVTDWTIAVKNSELATFNVSFDSQQENGTQSYTSPSYVTDNILNAAEASLILGGTVSTSTGVTTVGGSPTTITLARDCSIKVTNPMNTKRFFLGSLLKQEPLENAPRQISGSFSLDFAALTTVYDAYIADTSSVLQLNFAGPAIHSSTHSAVNILIPSLWFDEDQFPATSADVIQESVTFKGLDDGTDNQIQLEYITLDTTPTV